MLYKYNIRHFTFISALISVFMFLWCLHYTWESKMAVYALLHLFHVLDYGDLLYMHTPVHCLQLVDIVYYDTLRYVTGGESCQTSLPLICPHWVAVISYLQAWYLPFFDWYGHSEFTLNLPVWLYYHSLCSNCIYQLIRTKLGKQAFMYRAS